MSKLQFKVVVHMDHVHRTMQAFSQEKYCKLGLTNE